MARKHTVSNTTTRECFISKQCNSMVKNPFHFQLGTNEIVSKNGKVLAQGKRKVFFSHCIFLRYCLFINKNQTQSETKTRCSTVLYILNEVWFVRYLYTAIDRE